MKRDTPKESRDSLRCGHKLALARRLPRPAMTVGSHASEEKQSSTSASTLPG